MMKFFDVVERFKDVYHSIDIRVVAYYQDNIWNVAYLAIRFRLDDVDKVKNEHDILLGKIGRIDNDEIRIRLYSFGIDKWDNLKETWYKNFIMLEDNFSVNFEFTDDLNKEQAKPQDNYDELMNMQWPSYSTTSEVSKQNVLQKITNHDQDARKK